MQDRNYSYEAVKDDPGFLSVEDGTQFHEWFLETTGLESWSETAHRMTSEGIPCVDIWDSGAGIKGFLFEDPKQKFEFILRCK
jgi:hypothetical protein